MKTRYVLLKDKRYKKCLEFKLNDSYDLKKRKNKDGIGLIKVYDNKLVVRVIKRKFDERVKKILELILNIEESDEDPSEGYITVLNEADKLKHELINKYREYLRKEQLEFLTKKVEIIEMDIKNKLMMMQLINKPIIQYEEYEEEMENSRRR